MPARAATANYWYAWTAPQICCGHGGRVPLGLGPPVKDPLGLHMPWVMGVTPEMQDFLLAHSSLKVAKPS